MLAPNPTTLSCEWKPLAALGAHIDAWRDLVDRAVEANVFYEPAFALAAAPVFGRGVGAVLVWDQDGRLVGLFLTRHERLRIGLPVLVAWTHPFAPLGTPLIDRGAPASVIDAFLDHVAGNPALPKLLLVPYLATEGIIARTLADAIAARGCGSRAFDAHERALLAIDDNADGETYLADALGRKKRRELARQRRRLADDGDITCAFETAPAGVDAVLADFLALEISGWKGRANSAAAQDDAIGRFLAAAIAGLAAEGKVLGVRLDQGGRAIAATLMLRSGTGSWAWKIAYDEAAARGSPGVQIMIELTRRLFDEPGVSWCDSCATPDHAMIDRIWRQRLPVEDRLVAIVPSAPFALAAFLEGIRRRLIATAKWARDLLRTVTGRAR